MDSQEQRFSKYKRNTELRHLDPKDVYQLGLRLDENDYWKKLMQVIPKKLDCQNASDDGQLDWSEAMDLAGAKYSNSHITRIEDATKRGDHTRMFTQTLIDEWGTSGRKHERPTVGVLLQLLVKANLFRAADFVAVEFLGETPPVRPLEGPARRIAITLNSEVFNDIQEMVNDSAYYPDTEALNQNIPNSSSIVANNIDFYTKYKCTEKDINVTTDNSKPTPPPRHRRNSRLKKVEQKEQQNSNSKSYSLKIEGTTGTLNKISKTSSNGTLQPIQERDCNSSEKTILTTNNQDFQMQPAAAAAAYTNNSNNSQLDSTDSNPLTTNTQSTQLSSATIPNLSIFLNSTTTQSNLDNDSATASSTTNVEQQEGHSNNCNEILPIMSALNLNGDRDDDRDLDNRSISPASERSDSNLSKDVSLDEDISYTNDSKDDEDGLSIPNLSNFGERQSNNDSSLTSVTGTSGENSFELSTNESISSASNDENIPCLSIFNQ